MVEASCLLLLFSVFGTTLSSLRNQDTTSSLSLHLVKNVSLDYEPGEQLQ